MRVVVVVVVVVVVKYVHSEWLIPMLFSLNHYTTPTGSLLWKLSVSGDINRRAALSHDETILYFGSHDHTFYAINTTDQTQVVGLGLAGIGLGLGLVGLVIDLVET